ncbi:hypothetical protein DOY81_010236 [Sarcophaga bullata]|nr:hypothetical protein DOY81_010236 [Sarcophaga bullata]
MLLLQVPCNHLQQIRHKPMWTFLFLYNCCPNVETEAPQTTTPEPDASPGCKAPDISFPVLKQETTTQQPYAKFITTQVYPPDDLTTGDVEYVERINIDLTGRHNGNQMGGIVNPYQVNINDHRAGAGIHANDMAAGDEQHDEDDHDDEDEDDEEFTDADEATKKKLLQNRKLHEKNRRTGSGRRRRIENENGQTRGRGSRYKRQVIHHDPDASPDTDKWSGGKLAAEGDVYYIHIDDILKSQSPNEHLKLKLYRMKQKVSKNKKSNCTEHNCPKHYKPTVKKTTGLKEKPKPQTSVKNAKNHHRRRGDSHEQKDNKTYHSAPKKKSALSLSKRKRRDLKTIGYALNDNQLMTNVSQHYDEDRVNETGPPLEHTTEIEADAKMYSNMSNDDIALQRVKRKSGKTTGALSRPKGGGDSSSKSTSRKDKGIFDEEGTHYPVHTDEGDSEEEDEEEDEIDIQQQFTEVSEIRFPGEIGPLGDRRLCKIRCIKGKWVGPLCATNEEELKCEISTVIQIMPRSKNTAIFTVELSQYISNPITRARRYRTVKIDLISNTQINVGWDLPHGHSLQARCKDLGMYKLLGESRVLCSNGLWAPRMPSCVPTTLLTNFSDDSAPSIKYRIINGSGSFEPSGVLAVLPNSTILLDCIYPRARGIPEIGVGPVGWTHEDKNFRYRLTIKQLGIGDSGTFTCTSPRGLTNSVAIVMATSTCPQLPEPALPLSLRLEGDKLGQRALYRCPPGFRVDGIANATCLASGNWSSPPPTCQAVQCPRLILDDPHLSLVELNTSAWGRAVFKCQWGFKLTGPPGLECDPTGVWSGPVPRCKAIQCPTPVAPLNGKSQCPYPGDPPNGLLAPLKFNYDSGDYISVQCRPGYVQYSENGPPERPKCQPDGNWSGPVPKCRSYEEV